MTMFANEEELRRVYKLLTDKDGNFEHDKVDVINCETSTDIKACPGSGKTTTLLAKLVLLAVRMPLASGKGVCVLTYTNVAIDEIKAKLGHKADVLFSYPNYFGTMQTFVDDFFASAALQHYYGARITLVDDDRANQEMYRKYKSLGRSKLVNYLYWSVSERVFKLSKQEVNLYGGKDLLAEHNVIEKKKNGFVLVGKRADIAKLPLSEFSPSQINSLLKLREERNKSLPAEEDFELSSYIQSAKYNLLEGKIESIGKPLTNLSGETAVEYVSIKEDQFKKGLLKFYDSYNLALRLIKDFPSITDDLSERFEYLFVDEMQDTGKIECDFLKAAFNRKKIKIQYFGDEDQAIYQKAVMADSVWQAKKPMMLNSSKRFGEEIAKVINPFRLDSSSTVKGNLDVQSLQPVLLVYSSPQKVLLKFEDLLRTKYINVDGQNMSLLQYAKLQRGKDPLKRYNIKAVGWVGTKKDNGALSIQSYYPEYQKANHANLKEAKSMMVDFVMSRDNTNYQNIVKNLIAGILEFLRCSGIRKCDGYYTKQTLFDYMEAKYESELIKLKELLAVSASKILSGNFVDVLSDISKFLSECMSKVFIIDESLVSEYCKHTTRDSLEEVEGSEIDTNVLSFMGAQIKVDTVHSVKGETHIATLYMETSYQKKCESEYLWEQFKGNAYVLSKGDTYKKEALKIAYVAMSRPKYFLCVAIDKKHFQDCEEVRKLWDVIEV